MYTIYLYINYRNRKMYVGQTTDMETRHRMHMRVQGRTGNSHFHNAIKRHGARDVFRFMILKDNIPTVEEANEWEKSYIRTCRVAGIELYNLLDGGGGKTEADKALISQRVKAALSKPEMRQHLSDMGKKHYADPVNRKKQSVIMLKVHGTLDKPKKEKVGLSEAMKRKWEDPEYRDKMSKLRKKKWEDAEYRKGIMDQQAVIKADPAYRDNMKEKMNDPEMLEHLRDTSKRKWEDPEYRKRQKKTPK